MEDKSWNLLKDRNLELGPRPTDNGAFEHWRLTRDAAGIAWAVLDKADSSVNTLSVEVMEELSRLLDLVEQRMPKALVFRSAKPSGFLAGADINQFRGMSDIAAITKRIEDAHAIIDRVEALTIPTIAVMHGHAVGGGLELGLACTYRIAVEGASFGFPEVQIGLHPGLGGTARFVRQIDPIQAMSYMLTGKTIHDRKAKALGLVDALVPERHVRAAVDDAANGTMKQAEPGLIERVKDSAPARRVAARQMRAEAEKRAPHEHYPAPYALIDNWERHGSDFEAMKRAEIESFARLMVTDTAQNLIRVFFLREAMKRNAGKADKSIRHVHVIGAGAMGGDIASWCAWRGLKVTLADVKPEPIGKAIARASELFGKIAHGNRIRIRDALDRLIPDLNAEGLAHADLIIEAAPEKAALKKSLYATAEARMKDSAILATNTSSIPLEELREGLARPERLIGLHFFNPVSRMQLVEVVRHDRLDQDVERRALAFTGMIDRLPVRARSAPGFIVNRALTPYLVEAMIMLDEGVERETIDRAATEFGMPVGPLELADQVGLDIGLDVADMLKRDLKWSLPDAPQWLRVKVAQHHLGRKTGEGVYAWKNGEAVKKADAPAPDPEMTDRLILPILNTCVALLREGISDDQDMIDGAMIFGTGFAPFTGGPLHYARQRGVEKIKARLSHLAEKYGERFQPDAGWDALA